MYAQSTPLRICHGPNDSILVQELIRQAEELVKQLMDIKHGEKPTTQLVGQDIRQTVEGIMQLIEGEIRQVKKPIMQQVEEDVQKLPPERRINWELLNTFCYVEAFDILVGGKKNGEIGGVKFGSESSKWNLTGVVGDLVIKPDAVTTDAEGNIYVSDGTNNRILKLNALNGDIISTILLEEDNKENIRFLLWLETEPNLTTISGDRISTYNILKLY